MQLTYANENKKTNENVKPDKSLSDRYTLSHNFATDCMVNKATRDHTLINSVYNIHVHYTASFGARDANKWCIAEIIADIWIKLK